MSKKPPRTMMVFKDDDGIWRPVGFSFVGDAEKPPDDYYQRPIVLGPVDIGEAPINRAVRVSAAERYGWVAA